MNPGVPTYAWDGEDKFGCPYEAVSPAYFACVRLFSHYKSGYLWKQGGLAEQPHVYLRCMEVVNSEVNKIEAERYENMKNTK